MNKLRRKLVIKSNNSPINLNAVSRANNFKVGISWRLHRISPKFQRLLNFDRYKHLVIQHFEILLRLVIPNSTRFWSFRDNWKIRDATANSQEVEGSVWGIPVVQRHLSGCFSTSTGNRIWSYLKQKNEYGFIITGNSRQQTATATFSRRFHIKYEFFSWWPTISCWKQERAERSSFKAGV